MYKIFMLIYCCFSFQVGYAEGLKVEDFNNKKIDQSNTNNFSNPYNNGENAAPSLSKEEQEKLKKQIEAIKKNSQQNQEILKQLLEDDDV
jgi:hypothetical protein